MRGKHVFFLSRKQLVMVVTYRSSVTLPVWTVSPQSVTLSNPDGLPNHQSLSLVNPLLHFSPAFLCLSAVLLSSIVASSHPDNPPLLPFLPFCSYWSKMFAKTSTVTRHSCPQVNRLICLSCVDTHTCSLLNIQLGEPFRARVQSPLCVDVHWQTERRDWWSSAADESDGM